MNYLDLFANALRYGVFISAGIGVGFMLMTNVIAFQVLRPPKKLGFLWWHVTSISLSFLMIGTVAMDNIVSRIGDPFTWRAPLMFVGTALYAVAQAIIFRVERSRLIQKKALEIVDGQT